MNHIDRVEKPWGHEIIWAQTRSYAAKILHINKGESLSLQYHEIKDETIYVLSGRLRFVFGENSDQLNEKILEVGDAFHVFPGLHHQMEALEACVILEASTPELDDVVRLKDRYGRV